jgi:photosystem II stability/assembly factor-like uncharacterized protein
MFLRVPKTLIGLLAVVLVTGCGPEVDPAPAPAVSNWHMERGRPRPTSDLLGDVWAEGNGVERKRWLADMHRSAQGDDWRALERANASAELGRRASLASGVLPIPGGTWEEVGSSNQAGHTRSAAVGGVRPGGARALYIGSANGGLWGGDLEGESWRPLSDALFGGVDGVLALPPSNPGAPEVLLIRRGAQVFLSADGGGLWRTPVGLERARTVQRMAHLAGDGPQVALLAQDQEQRVLLLVSSDRGASFSLRWTGPAAPDADLWAARTGDLAGRELWVAAGGSLLRSLDGGKTFGRPRTVAPEASKVVLSASEAGGPRVYLAARVAGRWDLHRGSPDAEFERVGELGDCWGQMVAFSGDPDVVLVGGLEVHRSTDGGASFRRLNSWGQYYSDPLGKLHADVRGLTTLPDPDRAGEDLCLISTDGGTYLSTDRGATVRNLSLEGLGVGQIYSTLSASSDPGLILAGTQDQGYQRGRLRPATGRGPSTPFDQLLSGDYGYLTSAGGNHDLVYASYPGFVLVQEGAATPDLLYPWIDLPENAKHAWMPPIVADPVDGERFYLLADHLYRYQRKQGPYWTYRRHSAESFAAGGAKFLTTLAFAPSEPGLVLAANDRGRLWRSTDGGEGWSLARVNGNDHLRPTSIAVHPTDPRRAVVGGAGYSGPAVLASEDGGRSWRPMGEGLPRTLVYDLAWAADGSDDLYAACEAGAWRLKAGAGRWQNIMGRGAPATTYWCVEAVGDTLRFGTYGRGIWDYRATPPEAR